MLIEFSVSNFRSIRERQTLSMVAAPRLRRNTTLNVFEPDLPGERFPRLLKVAVIYGPNASGKSNLLRALTALEALARQQATAVEGKAWWLPSSPFRFDPALATQPSEFEIHFIHEQMRYQFDVHVMPDHIAYERLIAYPRGDAQLLYERKQSDNLESYKFGDELVRDVGEDLLDTWEQITPSNLLFLSQAVANSKRPDARLQAAFQWLSQSVYPMLNGMDSMQLAAQELVADVQPVGEDIAEFLREVDVPIVNFEVEIREPLNALAPDAVGSGARPKRRLRTMLTHSSALGTAKMTFFEESRGTQNLVGFWLPWSTRSMTVMPSARRLLVVDELDSSLHPKIVEALVEKHITHSVPTQLIFTTHDTHLMDAKLLRRDQIWITERDVNGATQLRCVHDFEGREGEDIEKRYFAGRYRGLPLVILS